MTTFAGKASVGTLVGRQVALAETRSRADADFGARQLIQRNVGRPVERSHFLLFQRQTTVSLRDKVVNDAAHLNLSEVLVFVVLFDRGAVHQHISEVGHAHLIVADHSCRCHARDNRTVVLQCGCLPAMLQEGNDNKGRKSARIFRAILAQMFRVPKVLDDQRRLTRRVIQGHAAVGATNVACQKVRRRCHGAMEGRRMSACRKRSKARRGSTIAFQEDLVSVAEMARKLFIGTYISYI